jgi:type IV pilus assembly protein PilA
LSPFFLFKIQLFGVYMSAKQAGFTLIELIIVVSIIGILMGLSLPAYKDYVKRAHVAEGMGLATSAKSAIADYYGTNGKWPSNNTAAGMVSAASIKTNAVRSVHINSSQIIIVFNTKVSSSATLILQGGGENIISHWSCSGGTLEHRYRPSACR